MECSLGTSWGGKADAWDLPAGTQGPPGWPARPHWLPGAAGILGTAEPAERPEHRGPGPKWRWEDHLLRAGPGAPGGDGGQCGWQCLRYCVLQVTGGRVAGREGERWRGAGLPLLLSVHLAFTQRVCSPCACCWAGRRPLGTSALWEKAPLRTFPAVYGAVPLL